jgi:hypothetical protein
MIPQIRWAVFFENMAERVGFETVLKRQPKDLTEHGQQS